MRRHTPIDKKLLFGEGVTLTADGAIQASSADVIVNCGPGGRDMLFVADISAANLASGHRYVITVQGTNDATFGTAANSENLAQIEIGHTGTRAPTAKTSAIGRYEIPFTNDVNGVTYKNLRVYVDVTGGSPSITFGSAFVAPLN